MIQLFEIENQIGLRGLKFVNINLPIDSELRQKDDDKNDIHNLIQEIMGEFNATPEQLSLIHI